MLNEIRLRGSLLACGVVIHFVKKKQKKTKQSNNSTAEILRFPSLRNDRSRAVFTRHQPGFYYRGDVIMWVI